MILDKDHTKEYKRARNELKKRSSDTLRLQKKAKKGTSDSLQSIVDASMSSVNQQKAELDEVERKSLRSAMIEDRTRYCHFVNMLQPVVKQEYEMMYELGHLQVRKIPERISSRKPSITFLNLQEAMQTVTNVTKDPTALPQASEELIAESKTSFNFYPDSPTHSSSQGCSNSLGSRKSSVCSISSMNSSGSSGSPGHQFQRSLSQVNQSLTLRSWWWHMSEKNKFVLVTWVCLTFHLFPFPADRGMAQRWSAQAVWFAFSRGLFVVGVKKTCLSYGLLMWTLWLRKHFSFFFCFVISVFSYVLFILFFFLFFILR